MNGKALTALNPGSLVDIFSDYGCLKHKKKFVFLKDSVVQNFLKAEVKQNTKTKQKPIASNWADMPVHIRWEPMTA